MKRTVLINQDVLFSIDRNLDFNDAAIIHYLIDFSHLAKKMIDLGSNWFWVSSSKIIKDLPMLKITTNRGIAKRIDKIIDAGLLVRHPENQSSGQSFYRFGVNYEQLISKEEPKNESSNLRTTVPTPLEQPFQPPKNNRSNNSSINDISINDNNKKSATGKPVSASLFEGTEFEGVNPNKKTLFENSKAFDYKYFESKFSEPEFSKIDLNYYYQAVNNWSSSKNEKRTLKGWIATARNFMLRDNKAGKLELKNKGGQNLDSGLMDYLKMGQNGTY